MNTGAREVIILLDRSASMGYGDPIGEGRSAQDRPGPAGPIAEPSCCSIGVEETVRATSDHGALRGGDRAGQGVVGCDAPCAGVALAQSKLNQSNLPRKEAVLISDFQKTGWEGRKTSNSEGATLAPSRSRAGADLAVTSVALPRQSFATEEPSR